MSVLNTILVLLLFSIQFSLNAQTTSDDPLVDERFFYAENKQLNQFFRRFNGEEDILGNRYYEKDKLYRDTELRRGYIVELFDQQNKLIKEEDKNAFKFQVTNTTSPQFLDFHGGKWMAEVQAKFHYMDSLVPFKLFFKLQKEEIGSKWVLYKVNTSAFYHLLYAAGPEEKNKKFLHPLSHELDFTNLVKYFKAGENLAPFVDDNFEQDDMSLFLYALKKGDIVLQDIKKVKFHFWQIPGWYFEVERFNRKESYNNGLLISKLSRVPEKNKGDWINAIIND